MKIAFVHIEKTAGTTFIHLLRTNFLFQYIDVRPIVSENNIGFAKEDLRLYKKLNPFLRSIGGHSVIPGMGLEEEWQDVQYVTLLRDPVKRVISHYLRCVDHFNYKVSVADFIRREDMVNFQTKKISRVGEVNDAMNLINNQFLLAGTVERFDDFLFLLQKKISGEKNSARIINALTKEKADHSLMKYIQTTKMKLCTLMIRMLRFIIIFRMSISQRNMVSTNT